MTSTGQGSPDAAQFCVRAVFASAGNSGSGGQPVWVPIDVRVTAGEVLTRLAPSAKEAQLLFDGAVVSHDTRLCLLVSKVRDL
jgi:hypothetical protein